MNSKKSRSDAQQAAQSPILAALNKRLGPDFNLVAGNRVNLSEKIWVEPDGVDRKNKVLCECYARTKKAKGGNVQKVRADILRLLVAEKHLGGKWQKIIAFQSEALEKQFGKMANNWTAEAARVLDIKIMHVDAGKETREAVEAAEKEQIMVNN